MNIIARLKNLVAIEGVAVRRAIGFSCMSRRAIEMFRCTQNNIMISCHIGLCLLIPVASTLPSPSFAKIFFT
ncbi:MAG: hypothetical protein ABI262_06445 [Microcoleus sp.]